MYVTPWRTISEPYVNLAVNITVQYIQSRTSVIIAVLPFDKAN